MKIFLYDDDPRRFSDSTFSINKGSFSVIVDNLNQELDKLGLLGDAKTADWIGFATGIKLDFGFPEKRKFLIHVWESDQLPHGFANWRRQSTTKVLGLSKQVQNLWVKYKFNDTPIVDIGVDIDFFQPQPNIPRNEKFTFLSVTSCNWRSGINHTLIAFEKFAFDKKDKVKLIIKNTDERAYKLPWLCDQFRQEGYDVEYTCKRLNIDEIRDLYSKSHVLLYNPIMTSAGLPIPEVAAMKLPCIVGDFCPTNIYPHSEAIKCALKPIIAVKNDLCNKLGLPYTFPEGWIDEFHAHVYWLDNDDFVIKMDKIYNNYGFYLKKAEENRKIVEERWTWKESCNQLLKALNYEEKTK